MFVGAVLLIAPGIALDVVCIIFGIYMIIYGAVKIMGYFAKDAYQLAFQFDLALGIVIAIVGIVFVCRTARVVQLLSTCIGIVMLVDATFKIQTSIDSKRFGISRWWLMLILAVIVPGKASCPGPEEFESGSCPARFGGRCGSGGSAGSLRENGFF